MLSVSFKKGFWRGFTSPANLFMSSQVRFPEPVRLEDAWREVEEAMAEAMGVEGEKNAESTQRNTAKARQYPAQSR